MVGIIRNIVTVPGDSDPQVSAVVGESGIKSGLNVVGSLRSSSHNRERARVDSQAPVSLTNICATETSEDMNAPPTLMERLVASKTTPSYLILSMQKLKTQMKVQNGLLNSLFKPVDDLTELRKATRSDPIRDAIDSLKSLSDELYKNRSLLHGHTIETEKLIQTATQSPAARNPTSEKSTNMKQCNREESMHSSVLRKPTPEKSTNTEQRNHEVERRLDAQDAKLKQILSQLDAKQSSVDQIGVKEQGFCWIQSGGVRLYSYY